MSQSLLRALQNVFIFEKERRSRQQEKFLARDYTQHGITGAARAPQPGNNDGGVEDHGFHIPYDITQHGIYKNLYAALF